MKFRHILAFGSNEGDHALNFSKAFELLSLYDKSFVLLKLSPTYVNAPFVDPTYDYQLHEKYSNFIIDCKSDLSASHFYETVIVPIEDLIGHCREQKKQPRKLDIDVLLSALDDSSLFQNCTPLEVICGDFIVPHLKLPERQILREILERDLGLDVVNFERTIL